MPFDFQCGDALLRCASSPERIGPMPKFDARFLVNRTNANRELLLAVPAAPQEPLVALARLGICHLVHFYAATLDAAGVITPPLLFEKLNSRQFIGTSQRNLADDIRSEEHT